MIDLHTHTLLSDGSLIPAELVQRARKAGLSAIAITDHVDSSSIESVIAKLLKFTSDEVECEGITVIPGVELTHIRPSKIADAVKEARELGAKIVVVHGESIVEPVESGTNLAAINAGADILAHPGLISAEECRVAAEKGVHLEITSRQGHSLTNGHVAKSALSSGAPMVVNSDTHDPSDIITLELAKNVALGAGLDEDDFKGIIKNAQALVSKTSS